MEFISEIADKKTIIKQDIGINPFLIENNLKQIEQIMEFFQSESPLMLVNGFMGTGKVHIVNQSLSFLNEDVITLKYNCFETTILDDILLEFFENFKKLTTRNIIKPPKAICNNFTEKINTYFESVKKPIVIVINSFEQVLEDYKPEIIAFLYHLSKFQNIKTIIIARKFNYTEFKCDFKKVSISAFEKGIFEKYLRSENFKQIGPLSDELYRQTRGYYFYTTLSIKIMQYRKLNLADFLSGHSKSFLTFNDFILREALSLVDPISGHLFRFLTIMRHPVNVKLLQTLNLYDADRIAYFIDNMVLTREGSLIYLQDYYKVIAENSIADNIAVKIHKNCIELYNTQLPLKPLERDLLISRQTMRKEIEYHNLFIPQKPAIPQKPIEEVQFIEQKIIPQTIQEKDEQIKHISFVFESEENEMAILNKIAGSIEKFVDISDRKSQALDEMKNKSLVDLINLAKKEEQTFDYLKAAMIYQKALTMNNDDDYYTFLPVLYTKLAQAFKNMSDWFNSQKYYELAVEFYISTGDDEKINECKYEIANIFYITFKQEKAIKLVNEILSKDISPNLKAKTELLRSNMTGENISLPENTDKIDRPILAELYFKYALYLDEQGDIVNAVKYYKKCVEISRDQNLNTWISSSLTNLAAIYNENGKSDLAVKYLKESIRLDEQAQNLNGIYIACMKLSQISNVNKLQYLKRAKKCAEDLNDKFYISTTEDAIGDFYFNQKDYKNAQIAYQNAKNFGKDDLSRELILNIELKIKACNNEQ